MCGIAGIYSNRIPDFTELKSMSSEIHHRGPDGDGIFISKNNKCGFIHRRLSIIDLSENGKQPMCNEDGSIWITFNGEIYNYVPLRVELKKNHKFKSNTDTEVIIHLYEEYGIDCLSKIDGMFAFAIYDEKKERLLIARDRFGKKPLYYTLINGTIIFASEIKAILKYSGINAEMNDRALSLYLNYLVPPSRNTMFKNIFKLPNSHYIYLSDTDNPEIKEYYSIEKMFSGDSDYGNENEVESNVFSLLENSIKKRMMSDVPYGVFLSGGVDSSTNVAIMSQLVNKPVETFSVAIKNDNVSDELTYSRKVSDLFKTNHHEIIIDDNDFMNLFDNLAYYQDEPLADPVCVPLYYVAKLAQENGVKVVQLGEGSDEIFAGYPNYQNSIKRDRYIKNYSKYIPYLIKKLVYSAGKIKSDLRVNEILRRTLSSECYYNLGSSHSFFDEQLPSFIVNPEEGSYTSSFDYFISKSIFNGNDEESILNNYVYHELIFRIPELLLMRVDKMLMANGIEGRAPFLDKDLVEYAVNMPMKYKIRDGEGKYILKRIMEKYLPKEILYRKKIGFCGSSSNMFSEEIRKYAYNLLVEKNTLKEWIDLEAIKGLFEQHRYGKEGSSSRIWTLMNLALWKMTWF